LITSGGSSDTFINSKNNVLKETFLATSLDKLITRDPSRFMRSLAQEINTSEQLLERWCQRMGQVALNCHYTFQQAAGQCSCPQQQEERRTGSRRCLRRISGLPAPLTATVMSESHWASLD
jgi:hypothetical protein